MVWQPIPMGLIALGIYAGLIMVSFFPIIILRRLWNRQHQQNSSDVVPSDQPVTELFAKNFLPLLVATFGAFVILIGTIFATQSSTEKQNNSAEIWINFAILELIITGPWLVALLYNWQKGVFNNEQRK